MLSNILADFYERDLNKFVEEINLFRDEKNLWRIVGTIKNSSGNLALHIIGGLNHFFGATLAHSGYIRDRDLEFSQKGVDREELVTRLQALIPMMKKILSGFNPEQMEAEYPLIFDNMKVSNSYLFVRMLAHLGYHLGQVNYLRRTLE
ncbi:MAG: DUF1572 family protein [Bacteroidota bacterium]|nr:DUF1572 family protein [Bacteroidota bacterium]MDP4252500.1 DUF1572 family protein [Bacteroidota bacterium]